MFTYKVMRKSFFSKNDVSMISGSNYVFSEALGTARCCFSGFYVLFARLYFEVVFRRAVRESEAPMVPQNVPKLTKLVTEVERQ